jgi:hypothetical protein
MKDEHRHVRLCLLREGERPGSRSKELVSECQGCRTLAPPRTEDRGHKGACSHVTVRRLAGSAPRLCRAHRARDTWTERLVRLGLDADCDAPRRRGALQPRDRGDHGEICVPRFSGETIESHMQLGPSFCCFEISARGQRVTLQQLNDLARCAHDPRPRAPRACQLERASIWLPLPQLPLRRGGSEPFLGAGDSQPVPLNAHAACCCGDLDRARRQARTSAFSLRRHALNASSPTRLARGGASVPDVHAMLVLRLHLLYTSVGLELAPVTALTHGGAASLPVAGGLRQVATD